jgi:spore germination protein
MNWKRLFVVFMVLALPLACWHLPKPSQAAASVNVFVNGEKIAFPDVQPVVADGRVLVPVRFVVENPAFGSVVSYDWRTKKVTIKRGDTTVECWLNSQKVLVNGSSHTLDVAPIAKNGRTLVPLRFLSETLGADVEWDGTTGSVLITMPLQGKIVLGYYYGGSYSEFQERYANLTDVAFHWYSADEKGDLVDKKPQGYQLALDLAREKGLRTQVSVILSDRAKLHALLSSKEARQNFVKNALSLVEQEGYQVFNLDFEQVKPEDKSGYNALLAELSQALKQKQIGFYVTAPPMEKYVSWYDAYDYGVMGKYADKIVIMVYDLHYRTGPPGPIAPYDWAERVISYARQYLPADQIIFGLGIYGRDWPEGAPATSLTYQDAEALAAAKQVQPVWHSVYCLPHFEYIDETGLKHEVWYENEASLKLKLDLANDQGLAGVSIWRLGFGFPDFWADIAVFK